MADALFAVLMLGLMSSGRPARLPWFTECLCAPEHLVVMVDLLPAAESVSNSARFATDGGA
ncbi:hypothetical protein ERC79_02905 [Rhodococcus sp. ABRD24]|uniref:hypothetical protein n=1 Tax=Rhodococcus sp. ABRD24 TaxID=2507582 RepID=UPI0010396C6F|nr:hypothetical protein [Rhodococcus sp. ABRD24]QBJ95028.1 hypothetical protein ERC79_02905 [Rhodococcus sp. ABRD24]